jgi:hypothetical protein
MVLVLIVTVAIAASSVVMVGPQILVIAPLALLLGLYFRPSPWWLVCFGYPFTFGLISAWIGCQEMPGYERTTAFAVSVGIGLAGCGLIATGVWNVLRGKDRKEADTGRE